MVIDGFDVVEDNTEEVVAAIDSVIARALEKVGLLTEGYAKLKCPVDTGNLRNSITHLVDGHDVYIGTNVEYAPYVFCRSIDLAGNQTQRRYLELESFRLPPRAFLFCAPPWALPERISVSRHENSQDNFAR